MPKLQLTALPNQKADLTFAVESNANKIYKFIRGHNEITNEKGWAPLDIPGFDPVPPVMLVHDILEHFPGDEYDPHNEYQAQGAMFWLRHEGGFFSDGDRTAEAVIKPAFGMLFQHILRKSLSTKLCPAAKEAHTPLTNIDTENEIHRTLANAREFILNLGEYRFNRGVSYPKNVGFKRGSKRLLVSLEQALGWMRIGYRRADIRYKGVDKKKLVTLYKKLMSAITALDYQAYKNEKPNTQTILQVAINPRKYTAKVGVEMVV